MVMAPVYYVSNLTQKKMVMASVYKLSNLYPEKNGNGSSILGFIFSVLCFKFIPRKKW